MSSDFYLVFQSMAYFLNAKCEGKSCRQQKNTRLARFYYAILRSNVIVGYCYPKSDFQKENKDKELWAFHFYPRNGLVSVFCICVHKMVNYLILHVHQIDITTLILSIFSQLVSKEMEVYVVTAAKGKCDSAVPRTTPLKIGVKIPSINSAETAKLSCRENQEWHTLKTDHFVSVLQA